MSKPPHPPDYLCFFLGLKGSVTFKEKNGKCFKAFNDKYKCQYKDTFLHIYFCVFKWGGFYKHLEKCLHEMTIVPPVDFECTSWSVAVSPPPPVCIFLSFLKKMWNLETWGRFNRVLLFCPRSVVLCSPSLSRVHLPQSAAAACLHRRLKHSVGIQNACSIDVYGARMSHN